MRPTRLFAFFLILVFVFTPNTVFVKADLGDPWASAYANWQYRTEITINNPNSYDLTNFQVKIVLDSTWPGWAHVNSDGSDIRFASQDGTTTIPYWIESWDYTSKHAVIWVKAPLIPASGSTTIYLYYGNANAVDESNPDAVFEFFDDFDGDSLDTNKWVVLDGTAAVTSGYVELNNGGSGSATIKTTTTINLPVVIEFAWMKVTGNEMWVILTDGDPALNEIRVGYSSGGVTFYYQKRVAGTISTYQSISHTNPTTMTPSMWIVTQLSAIYYENGVQINTVTTQDLYTTENLYIALQVWASAVTTKAWWDWIRVRKYADTEPTVTVSITEETQRAPLNVELRFTNDVGNILNNVTLYINGNYFGEYSTGDVIQLYEGNYTLTAAKEHYLNATKQIELTTNTTVSFTLERESYTVYFYAYDTNNTILNDFQVYANNTLLGTFNSGDNTSIKYGTYIFKFSKAGYRSVALQRTIDRDSIIINFTNILPGSICRVVFYFYDASNNSILSNLTVSINGENQTLNSGDILWLREGNYTFTFSKEGYKSKDLSLEITADLTISIYLAPLSNTEIDINQAVNMTELMQNITSTVTIEPINPYAKAFLDSGGSFGDTIKNAIKGDPLVKLILPQGLIFIITIIVLWQTQSPLAGLGGALITWAMFIAMLGEKPNLTNSGMTFVLVVFLVAWILWDLFYNYSRET